MQYIFENIGYFHCIGEVSALNIEFQTGVSLVQIDVTPNYRPLSYDSSFSQLVPALVCNVMV